jgi:hypothetical protein
MQPDSDNGRNKALKVAASVTGMVPHTHIVLLETDRVHPNFFSARHGSVRDNWSGDSTRGLNYPQEGL